jgi:hypothetical protein
LLSHIIWLEMNISIAVEPYGWISHYIINEIDI